MKRKVIALTTLGIAAAIGIGLVSIPRHVQEVKAESPQNERVLETVYSYDFERLPVGMLSADALYQDGLMWLREDAMADIIKIGNKNALQLLINGDDGGGYARMVGIGSNGGFKDLVPGISYEISVELDLTNIDATSETFFEFSVESQWTGVSIINGVVSPCDPEHVRNVSYKDGLLKFIFVSRDKAQGEDVRPYAKITVGNAQIGDTMVMGALKIKEAPPYAMDFEQYAVGTTAPINNVSNIANVYNPGMTSLVIAEDETHGHYLQGTYNNITSTNAWQGFYFNRLYNLVSGHKYRVSLDIFQHNYIEMYVKYNDSVDGCVAFGPDGYIYRDVNDYITAYSFDGTHLTADIIFDSAKNATWWQQWFFQFCIPANTVLDIRVDNFEMFDLTREIATISASSTNTTFACEQAFSAEGLVVEATRVDGTKFIVDNEYVTVDSSAYKADVPGNYQIVVKVPKESGGYYETSYQVTVLDKPVSIAVKSAPTKTEYKYGEQLVLSGAVITVTMKSGETQDVNVTSDMISGYNKNQLGEQTVTVTYQKLTATFTVTVVDYATGIEMKNIPAKTSYKYGEDIDVAGGKINIVKASGAKEEITLAADMVSGYNKNQLGEQTITVTYLEMTTTFKVNVVDYAVAIEIKSLPTKVEYKVGEELDVTGGVLKVTKASGAEEDVPFAEDMISGFDSSKEGKLTLTVTYDGLTTTFTINLTKAPRGGGGCKASIGGSNCSIIFIVALAGLGFAIRQSIRASKKED